VFASALRIPLLAARRTALPEFHALKRRNRPLDGIQLSAQTKYQ
jgi:hypothetical protein